MKTVKKIKSEPTYAQTKHLEIIDLKAADLQNAFLAAGVPNEEINHLRAIVINLKGMV